MKIIENCPFCGAVIPEKLASQVRSGDPDYTCPNAKKA